MTLRERRVATGLRQEDVARRLEVDQSTICHWEYGRNEPLRKYKKRLARLYRCTLEDIEASAAETMAQRKT